ncbi:MAG: autotransporter-associated beta strand repeat-containing protein [Chitinophagaceae bacterium]|nr:autotransporter-associated beta strand repeat-containing protein [Rubrivivax sp.]
MRPLDLSRSALSRAALLTLMSTAGGPLAHAADVTWGNGSGSFLWNASALNWSTGSWNNGSGDGAIFGATGAGAINVTVPISVNSLNFLANGFTLNGAGLISFVAGSSTLGTGFINVDPGVTATINTGINSAQGLFKLGGGTLQLGGPVNFSGAGFTLFPGGAYGAFPLDLVLAGASGLSQGGTVKLMNTSALPASTRVGISNGLLDIGSNNVTLQALTFINQADQGPWNPATNAAGVGVIGSGTLRVTGEINVIGSGGGNFGTNDIGANLDLGGGTQVIRVASNSSFAAYRALQIAGVISNGSLLKTYGITENGALGTSPDGMALYGNNTYTGFTIFNGGTNLVTGTNASTSLKVVGGGGIPTAGNQVYLIGANGSYLSASFIQASAGGQFIIDNNTGLAAGSDQPTIPAAQNNNRIRDDAEVRLRNGSFTYIGRSATAASETFGTLNVLGGNNVLTVTPGNSGSTATLTASGNLTLAPRATLQVNSATLGTASKVFVSGTLPAADATGILARVVSTSDFLTYNGSTGLTPYTGYATDFNTAGANVAITSAVPTVASSVNVNAVKRSGTFTTTIGAGQTLGVTSGMILSTSGTGSFTGGTIAFGAVPGVFFGNNVVSSALTGNAGLLHSTGALTLNGNLSGLSGTITSNSTLNLATNTFAGGLELRNGTLNLSTSQTLAGQGAIRIGVPENESNLVASIPSVNFSSAGAGAVIARDIIVDNGTQDVAGLELRFGMVPGLIPLSNVTDSQIISGNITLNSPLKIQGGGAAQVLNGATNFTGNISGPAKFYVPNGRVNFSGNVGNAGGFRIGEGGFTAQVIFSGTTTGSAPISLQTGNSTSLSYAPGALPSGPLTVEGADLSGFSATIVPLASSTIGNVIHVNVTTTANVGAGITADWNGPLNGSFPLIKNGTGTLVLGNAATTFTGAIAVNAGTLRVQGVLSSASVNVAGGTTLGGSGVVAGPVSVLAGGTLAPGNSVGTLGTGSVSLAGALFAEIDLHGGGAPTADLLNVTGSFGISGGSLSLSLSNLPGGVSDGNYLLVANDGVDVITGTFASISGLSAGYIATVDYAFNGVDSLGRLGTGNDLAVRVTAVPEPSSYAMLVAGGLVLALRRWRRSV